MGRGRKKKPVGGTQLGRFLRGWMEEHGWPRPEAAKRLGISEGTLRNIESGVDLRTRKPCNLRVSTLQTMAKAMGVSPDYLMRLQSGEIEAEGPAPTPTGVPDADPARLTDFMGSFVDVVEHRLRDLYDRMEKLHAQQEELEKAGKAPVPLHQRVLSFANLPLQDAELADITLSLAALGEDLRVLVPALEQHAPPAMLARTAAVLEKLDQLASRLPAPPRRPKPPPQLVDKVRYRHTEDAPTRPFKKYRQSTAAGPPADVEGEEGDIIDLPLHFAPEADFSVRVKGDSLVDIGIQDGDILYVKETTHVRPGQLVVARIDGHGELAKMLDRNKDGSLWLRARNAEVHARKPFPEFRLGRQTAIRGKVVGFWRPWDDTPCNGG